MPEREKDEMVALFAAFRDDARRDVRPVQSAAIRKVAHRRRQVRTVTVAAATLLVLVLPAAVWAVVRPPGPPVTGDPTPTATATATPSASDQPSPTVTADPAPTVVPGPDDLRMADLEGRPLTLPPWPVALLDQNEKPCPTANLTFNARTTFSDSTSGLYLRTEGWADTNRDGRLDLLVVVTCTQQFPSLRGRDVEQLVAFSRGPTGTIVTLGQVVTTSTGVGALRAVRGRADGTIDVDLAEYGYEYDARARVQTRTFVLNGQTGRQVGGPTAFPPDPTRAELSVTVQPLSLDPPTQREGWLRMTVTNSGPGRVERLMASLHLPPSFEVKPCQLAMGDADVFECQFTPLAAGTTVELEVYITVPADYQGEGLDGAYLWVTGRDEARNELPDLHRDDSQAPIVITIN